MGTARYQHAGFGTASLALAASGHATGGPGNSLTATEEWTGAGPATKTITVS